MSDTAAVTFPAWSAEGDRCPCTEDRRHNSPDGVLFGTRPPDKDCHLCGGTGVYKKPDPVRMREALEEIADGTNRAPAMDVARRALGWKGYE